MRTELLKLKDQILEDGIIDKDEVSLLKKELYSDNKIDEEEAEFLFSLNDSVSGKNNHPDWKVFFVEAISKYLLEDEISPNEIDNKEAEWLLNKIEKDEVIDEVELALLDNLKKKTSLIPIKLLNKINEFVQSK